ncbi:MAG: hypothetical protein QW056_00405 [Candidatus Bathyarchaeia archaeon]
METITKRHKSFIYDGMGVSNALVVLLSLILITIIVANVVIWGYQMNQLDWEKEQENLRVLNVERNNSVLGASSLLVLNGDQISGIINDTWEVDDFYISFAEKKLTGESASVNYYPSSSSTQGGTQHISGSIKSLYMIGDEDYMRFQSYDSYNYVYSQITFVSSGTGSGATQGQLTPSYPPNLQAGDLILLQIVVWDSAISISTPIGFTHLYTDKNETNSWQQWIFYKNATGFESGTVTITIGGNALKMARMYAFRNVDICISEGKNFKSGQSTRVYAPSVTTSGPKRLAIAFVSIKDDVAVSSFTGETGGDWIEQTEEYRFKSGNDRGCLQLQSAALENMGEITGGYFDITAQKAPAWGVSAFALVPKRVLASVQLVEVLFNGTCDNAADLSSLTLTVCSRSNVTGVIEKLQLYNYRSGAYSTSGQGYCEYIAGKDDENVSLSITINPAYFIDAETGEWSLKISALASIAEPFEFWVDYIELKAESQSVGETYGLSLIGNFPMNLTAFPLSEVFSIEIHLRFRASDGGEYWLLKAYDWLGQNYTEIGSLSPALSFRYYILSLGNNWQRYVNPANGTIRLLFSDEALDRTPTIIDIDLFTVKVILKNGAIFTFQNEGASVTRIVAIWVNNITHHNRYDIDIFVNLGEIFIHPCGEINLPDGDFIVKVVTERGNVVVFASR